MQQPHFTSTDQPQNIAAGRSPGRYVAQVRALDGSLSGDIGVIYASAPTAPSDPLDYFACAAGHEFVFRVFPGSDPVWVRSQFDGLHFVVALALEAVC